MRPDGLQADTIRAWARELGFAHAGVADVDLRDAEPGLRAWLAAGRHGEMNYMARHAALRTDAAALVPGTVRAVMVAADYAPADPQWVARAWDTLAAPERAYVSRYALGRDYHKVVRGRLQKLADRIAAEVGPFGYRAFCDSAPVMEVELARRTGLGWRGKHTLLLSRERGSTFFLGTLYVDLPLAVDAPASDHCGSCARCIEACPTGAIVAPYRLDARRCISYLTIELQGAIPLPLRAAIGNRVYGCDDCQLACPWNKWARRAELPDFAARPVADGRGLDEAGLIELFGWTREAFERHTAGSAIRRIGHERWLRNVAVALGNALRAASDRTAADALRAALAARADDPSELVREHVAWALAQRPAPPPPPDGARPGDAQPASASHTGSVTIEATVDSEIIQATSAPSPPIRLARM